MKHCRICGQQSDAPVLSAPEMMFGLREMHRYFQCLACGCLQLEHIPDDIARYYGDGYYSYGLSALNGWRGKLAEHRDRHLVFGAGKYAGIAGKLLAQLLPSTQFASLIPLRSWLKPGVRVLDVGCGSGGLVQRLRRIGLDAVGADPFIETDIMEGGSVLVHRARLDEIDGQFDLIMFHHSFEHMPDPAGTLQAAAERLTNTGWCLLRVPLASSVAFEHYRENWVQLDAPRHFYLHSEGSLVSLAASCGFTCDQVVHDSTAFQFWGSEQYRQGVPLRDPRSYAVDPRASAFTKEQISVWEARAQELNAMHRGDQAAFYLRPAQ